MRIGVAYYPEHWPEERWPVDARMLRETGMDVVRIGEFAWSRLEPRRGQYELEVKFAISGKKWESIVVLFPCGGSATGLGIRPKDAVLITASKDKHFISEHEPVDIDREHALTPDIRYSLYGTFVEMYLEQGRTHDAEELMPTVEAIAKAFPPAAEHLKQLKERMHH